MSNTKQPCPAGIIQNITTAANENELESAIATWLNRDYNEFSHPQTIVTILHNHIAYYERLLIQEDSRKRNEGSKYRESKHINKWRNLAARIRNAIKDRQWY